MVKIALVSLIFLATYFAVIWEKIHRTTVVLVGAALMLSLGLLPLDLAWKNYMDYNTLGLLIGMMITVGVIKKTGLLQYVAIKLTKLSRGNFFVLFLLFSVSTAFFSAFLDNVTTILVVAPITILIAETAGKNPLPFLISEVICSNVGGTATLIGDPPNMLVGSASGYSFTTFAANLSPIAILILVTSIILLSLIYRRHLRSRIVSTRFESMDEKRAIADPKLLRSALLVFGLTLIGFILHDTIHVLPSVVALAGAILILAVTRVHPDEALAEVEWTTLLFFVGLFVVVGAVDRAGLISALGRGLVASIRSPVQLRIIILWASGISSAFLGAVPVATAFIPLVQNLARELSLSPEAIEPLWWSLALGASLGGIGTIVGTAAAMVAAGISQRTRYRISYRSYFTVGSLVMLLSLLLATAYVLLRYR
jgi:Na+/H+ antiporter NhaD/arsenite permease-like protein